MLLPGNLMAAKRKETLHPSLKGKKVLFVWGGWEGHEPGPSVDIFVPWMKSEGAEVKVSDTLDSYLDEENKAQMDTWY